MSDGPTNNAAPTTAPGSASGGESTAAEIFSKPIPSGAEARARHESDMRAALRSSAVGDLFESSDVESVDGPDDVGIADLAARKDTDAQDPDVPEGGSELQLLREELAGYATYNNHVLQAVDVVRRQNQILEQRLARYEAIDRQLAAEAEAERRAAAMPDWNEDPQAALRATLHDEIGQVEVRMLERQQAEMERLRAEHQNQRLARTVLEDLSDAYTQWPEYGEALRQWGRHAVEHYRNVEGLDHATAAQYAQSYLSDLAMKAAMRGESPADALYNFLGAHNYYREEPAANAEPTPAPAAPSSPAPAQQAFIDRSNRSQAPAAAASPPTNDASLRALVLAAGRGDLAANDALLQHAAQLGDPRNDEARRNLMRQFGRAM